MSPGKKKKRPAKGSFLTRILGGGKSGRGQGGKAKGAAGNGKAGRAGSVSSPSGRADGGDKGTSAKARALTPLERSISEIKQMAKVGESDPQRLAMLLSNLLAGEQAKRQHDQQQFDEMVSGLLDQREGGDEDAG